MSRNRRQQRKRARAARARMTPSERVKYDLRRYYREGIITRAEAERRFNASLFYDLPFTRRGEHEIILARVSVRE